MRISDWSSDVCSSDLLSLRVPQARPQAPGNRRVPGTAGRLRPGARTASRRATSDSTLDTPLRKLPGGRVWGESLRGCDRAPIAGARGPARAEREGVVWGKSVSGRGVYGGRGIL